MVTWLTGTWLPGTWLPSASAIVVCVDSVYYYVMEFACRVPTWEVVRASGWHLVRQLASLTCLQLLLLSVWTFYLAVQLGCKFTPL